MTITVAQHTRQLAHRTCNETVRENAEGRPGELLPFICECERTTCCTTVWLGADEYDEARSYALPIIAPHHHAHDHELPLADALDAIGTALLQTDGFKQAA